jgi:alkylation response protein AidB-like acyl-CoA dehydrogenase
VPGGYLVHGQKVWTSTAQVASKIMLLTRTTKLEDCARPTDGITIFYTDLDRTKIEVHRIPKMGRKAVDSNSIFIDGLFIPDADRVGEEGKGFSYILHSLNPERLLVAAEAIAIGQDALRRATRYARERVVFGRPIGQNQGIQHPLAERWMALEAAWAMVMKGAWLYDSTSPAAPRPKPPSSSARAPATDACLQAVLTHGGFGYAKEYHVERLLREVTITRIATITEQLILSFVAEKCSTCRSRTDEQPRDARCSNASSSMPTTKLPRHGAPASSRTRSRPSTPSGKTTASCRASCGRRRAPPACSAARCPRSSAASAPTTCSTSSCSRKWRARASPAPAS